jgi:hypothetical protein
VEALRSEPAANAGLGHSRFFQRGPYRRISQVEAQQLTDNFAPRLPAATKDFGGLDSLIEDIEQSLRTYVPLEEQTLLLLAAFVVSTWVAECVPTPPLLNLWGPPGAENAMMQVLLCSCRRPLLVADASLKELCSLQMALLYGSPEQIPDSRKRKRSPSGAGSTGTTVDEQRKGERSEEGAAFVVEALLVLCRQNKSAVFIEEITRVVNAIFLGRNQSVELSSKKVGSVVRNELGLYAQRRGPGYQLRLDHNTRQCIQRLAETYCVLSLLEHELYSETADVSAASTQ